MDILACWRCEKPGHGYAECDRQPARTRKELDDRIGRLVERWDAGYGEISTQMKAKFIEIERKAFEKGKPK